MELSDLVSILERSGSIKLHLNQQNLDSKKHESLQKTLAFMYNTVPPGFCGTFSDFCSLRCKQPQIMQCLLLFGLHSEKSWNPGGISKKLKLMIKTE